MKKLYLLVMFAFSLYAPTIQAEEPASMKSSQHSYMSWVIKELEAHEDEDKVEDKERSAQRDLIELSIVFGVSALVVIVWLYLRHQRRLAREKTIQMALEKGVPFSAQLLNPEEKEHRYAINKKQHDLGNAVFAACLFIGIACSIWLKNHLGESLFFIFMAIGFILRAFIRHSDSSPNNGQHP